MSSGGAERDRTADPLLAKQVLSQLSYSPIRHPKSNDRFSGIPVVSVAEMVGLGRFELPTSPLSGVRSNQLSYRPRLAASPPGGARRLSENPHSMLKGFRGQRLNMLEGYAFRDHRAIEDRAKKD
jgi:hypothetical protein